MRSSFERHGRLEGTQEKERELDFRPSFPSFHQRRQAPFFQQTFNAGKLLELILTLPYTPSPQLLPTIPPRLNMFAARTSTSSLRSSSSSLLLFSRASFSSTSSVGNNPGKDGPSTMGISRKARLRSTYLTGGGGKVTNETPKRGKDSPFLPGGYLPKVSTWYSYSEGCGRRLGGLFGAYRGRKKGDFPTNSFQLDLTFLLLVLPSS